MIEKQLKPHELKYHHSDDLGFVFKGAQPSSVQSIVRLAETIARCGCSKKLPLFYTRVDSLTVAFVYGSDSGFLSGPFWQFAQTTGIFDGHYQIDTLSAWCNSQQTKK